MLVHIVGSRFGIVENIDHLRRLVEAVHEEGHTLARDWIEPTFEIEKKGTHKLDWVLVYNDTLDAINKADVVIADSTIPSFSVGYQVALAIQMKKPVLVLNKMGTTESPFASGIAAGIEYKEYDEKNVKKLVKDFLLENDIQSKDMRFNFFIDRQIYNYLRWASHKTGETKAEILRSLVLREIEKDNQVD
ncbi:MAG: hypothetical protein ACREGJ_02905 [Candidatus Saccharimonadales bacterium]